MSERRSPDRGSIGPNKGDLGPGDIEWVVTPQEAARGAAGRQAGFDWGDPSPLDESGPEPGPDAFHWRPELDRREQQSLFDL